MPYFPDFGGSDGKLPATMVTSSGLPIRSPKLARARVKRRSPSSRYYAGYDAGFVEDLIRHLDLDASHSVIDPWNGAGTTTTVAKQTGLTAVGIDINPVLVVIAKAKLLGHDATESMDALAATVLDRASRNPVALDKDPLEQWFARSTAGHLRSIEAAIKAVMVEADDDSLSLIEPVGLEGLSSLAASFYVVLFEVVRSFLAAYTTSNPTWVKTRGGGGKRISVARDRIEARFRITEKRHHQHVQQLDLEHEQRRTDDHTVTIHMASSTATGLDDDSADACITSPPYCTRIDYPVLTRPELAVLRADETVLRELRDASIGTPTVTGVEPATREKWGDSINRFLDEVAKHPSKASRGYYTKFFLQYFDSMHKSLVDLRRVLHVDAPCALVVQDSYYKEIRNDVASGLVEMGRSVGWANAERYDFPVARTMASLNAGSHLYRTTFEATETVLILRP